MSCASSCCSLCEVLEEELLRFKRGDSVICKTGSKTGQAKWRDGEIVQVWWQDPKTRVFHPYQVKLRTGQQLIYVPLDDDEVIRKIERAWWEAFMEQDDLSDEEVVDAIHKFGEGQDLDAKTYTGEVALFRALKCRWHEAVRTLLRLKADPNCSGQNSDHEARHEAESHSQCEHGGPDGEHRTALHCAAEQGHTAMVRLLLDARAALNARDAQHRMPLHLAIESSEAEAVRLLVDSRADINTGHMEIGLATAPVIDAAYRDDLALLRLLISAKADLDHRGKQDMTALHVAARGQHAEAARLLVEAGADAALLAGGRTAVELALKNGLTETAALLGCVRIHSGGRSEAASRRPAEETGTTLSTGEPVAKRPRAC